MATSTQYNPNVELDGALIDMGFSKTIYAFVSPETEIAKNEILGNAMTKTRDRYLGQFREAWTKKQDAYHEVFFDTWHQWSKPVVDLDRANYPFYYPTSGASEALRHLIFDFAAHGGDAIHVFEGEYEGFKAMAEAANLRVYQHKRGEPFQHPNGVEFDPELDRFYISQPSAIDGNVWDGFNSFVAEMPEGSVVADITYVGAVPEKAIRERFNLNDPAISEVVFSLSKPFGFYYDRIGGVFCRTENVGLFGNKWFKNLTSLQLGTHMLNSHSVFAMPHRYAALQLRAISGLNEMLGGANFAPSDVFIIATAPADHSTPMMSYVSRGASARICLTPILARWTNMTGGVK